MSKDKKSGHARKAGGATGGDKMATSSAQPQAGKLGAGETSAGVFPHDAKAASSAPHGDIAPGSISDVGGPPIAGEQPPQGFVPPGGTPQVLGGPAIDKVGVVGHVAWLMMNAPTHKHLFISDLEWLVLPPIVLNQFRLWRRQGVPVGFAAWAYVSEDVENRLKAGARKLMPTDWKSGDRLWLIDILVPFGGQQQAMQELKELIFKGQKVKMLQPSPGGGVAVVEW